MGIVAQLKVCKGCGFFFFSIHSSPTRMPMSSRREVHSHLHRSDAGEEPRKTTQSDAGEDQVPSVVDGLF